MKINLSIIVPVYNAKKTLVSCLSYINNQIFKSDLSIEVIIIIDDGKNYENIIPKMKSGIQVKVLKTKGIKTGPGNTSLDAGYTLLVTSSVLLLTHLFLSDEHRFIRHSSKKAIISAFDK